MVSAQLAEYWFIVAVFHDKKLELEDEVSFWVAADLHGRTVSFRERTNFTLSPIMVQ